MSKTVSQLKDEVAGLLTGTNLDNVTELDGAIERALRTFLQKASIPEASTSQILSLYDGVYDYTPPSNIFGGALRDVRPLGVSRTTLDYVYKKYIQDFDRTKAILPNGYQVTFETENGVNRMRIANTKAKARITLDTMTATTGWTASGSASSLVADETFFYQEPASLRFTLTGASQGILTKTLTTPLDLTTYQGVGVIFLALEIPSTNLTSVEIRLGSDSSNYYSLSVTQGFLGAWVAGDFLLTAFDLSQASTTGTPTITAMDYIRLAFTHGATMTNTRVGGLFISLPSPHKVIYETPAVFRNTSGTINSSIDANSDTILLNEAAYTILTYESAVEIGMQQGGKVSKGIMENFDFRLNNPDIGLYALYRANNPAQELSTTTNWYDD